MKKQRVELQFNGIVVIQSLPNNEPQTGRSLYEDVIRRLCQKGIMHSGIIDVKSKTQFMMLSEILLEKCQKDNLCPFLHFEIHGDKEGRGLVLANGELVTWSEVGSFTRSINEVLKNELFISLATCKGAYILKSIDDPNILAPFWGMVGPKDKIYNEDIIEDFTAFYQELLTSFDLHKSIEALNNSHNNSPYVLMTAEFVFEHFIEEYFNNKPLDKEIEFRELSPKMRILYPHLSQVQRDDLLKRRIDNLDRTALIQELKSIFLMRLY